MNNYRLVITFVTDINVCKNVQCIFILKMKRMHKMCGIDVLTSTSSSTTSSSTTSALYSKSRSLIGFESSEPLINGNVSRTSVDGRCCGSLINAFARKSLKSLDHFDGWSNLGGSLFWILSKTRIGDISLFGGSI